MKMSLASPLQVSARTDRSCPNGVKEEVLAEVCNGGQSQSIPDVGKSSENDTSSGGTNCKQELTTSAPSAVAPGALSNAQVRRVKWSKEEPLSVRTETAAEEIGEEAAREVENDKASH